MPLKSAMKVRCNAAMRVELDDINGLAKCQKAIDAVRKTLADAGFEDIEIFAKLGNVNVPDAPQAPAADPDAGD